MDIMDSTDTPTGGLDGTTASSSQGALPLSVDERDAFASSTDTTSGGSVPTSTMPGESFSSSGSAFDRLDQARAARVDEDLPNALPTSTDDVMMPTQEYATHPSVLSNDTASSLSTTSSHASAKASDMASDAKANASSMMDSISSKLHEAGEKASHMASEAKSKATEEYHHLKSDVSSHMPHTTAARSSAPPEATDTHPDAASMRDSHLHSNFSSLPTHENEVRAPASSGHVSSAQSRGLAAAAATEPKDPSASTSGMMATLNSLHQKLEDGVEVVKDKVDDWAEQHLRSTPKVGEHLSEAHASDLPTLVDSSNERNVDAIRARLHPSSERAGANATAEPNSFDPAVDSSA